MKIYLTHVYFSFSKLYQASIHQIIVDNIMLQLFTNNYFAK